MKLCSAKEVLFFSFYLLALLLTVKTPLQASIPEVKNTRTDVVYTDLQTAINEASLTHIDRLKITGEFVGNFTVDRNIILDGSEEAVLDGGNTGRVLTIVGVNIDKYVKIKDLTIQHGSNIVPVSSGAGIIFSPSIGTDPILYIEHSKIEHNHAVGAAGGLFMAGGQLKVVDSEFSHNTATFGGGLYCLGAKVDLDFAKISHNTSTSDGGGMNCANCGLVNISRSEFKHNHSGLWGGGLYLYGNNIINLNNIEVIENIADSRGGGLFCHYNKALSVNHSNIEKNVSGYEGGGVYNSTHSHGEETILNHSFITQNESQRGGGIYNTHESRLIMNQTSVYDNTPDNIKGL